jgi:hypothetical protein
MNSEQLQKEHFNTVSPQYTALTGYYNHPKLITRR